jgi:hypothetical protein
MAPSDEVKHAQRAQQRWSGEASSTGAHVRCRSPAVGHLAAGPGAFSHVSSASAALYYSNHVECNQFTAPGALCHL